MFWAAGSGSGVCRQHTFVPTNENILRISGDGTQRVSINYNNLEKLQMLVGKSPLTSMSMAMSSRRGE